MTTNLESKSEPTKNSASEPASAPKNPKQSAAATSRPGATETTPAPDLTQEKLAELTSDLQRTRADFENYRKNIEKEKDQVRHLSRLATVEKFLPLLDDFERALSAYPTELAPLKKNLEKTLASLSLEKIPASEKTPFDPSLHEAVMTEGDGEKELISETLRPGYFYEGAVLRPALVKVKLS